ncbi:MAG: hypothetical protein QG652_1767 [Pseudomonadota bacterium]|nr:hypothetical protein [Pseudomonadota bacterium]
MPTNNLRLEIEYQQLDRFCNQLLARSRDVVKTHESLITLETFIKVFCAAQQGSEAYKMIEELITRYTEQTRLQLLQQKTRELSQAIKKQDVAAVAAIHTPLSRNGFYLIAQSVVADLSPAEIQVANEWAQAWTAQAKQKADQLSQYPDAPDFRAAGIALEDYLAMADVSRYLAFAVGS